MKVGSQDTWVPSTWNRAGNRCSEDTAQRSEQQSPQVLFPTWCPLPGPHYTVRTQAFIQSLEPIGTGSWNPSQPCGVLLPSPHLIEAQRGQELPPGHTARTLVKESMGGPVSPWGGQTQPVRVHRGMGLWAAPQQAGGSGFSQVRKARPGVKSAPLRAHTARMQRAWRRNHSRGLRRSPWAYLDPPRP